jgi:hypothetical protein
MGKGHDPNCGPGSAAPAAPLSEAGQRALRDPEAARDLVLSRDEFRAVVFARDGYRCVICRRDAVQVGLDAHHIIERRGFAAEDPRPGGYVLDNGVTLCDAEHPDGRPGCHMQAEMTLIEPGELRAAAAIASVVLPDHLETSASYTKWLDEQLPDGRRLRGELFYEEPVQKVLRAAGVLDRYLASAKQPRTLHLPWSPGATADDKVLADTSFFEGKPVIATEKLDGEVFVMSREICHARSLDSGYHPARTRAKQEWAARRYEIPEGWRLHCENLAAQHHVPYDRLPGVLLVHAVYDERNVALSWAQTQEWAALLDLPTAPVVYDGLWDEQTLRALYPFQSHYGPAAAEGYVVRVAEPFRYGDFRRAVGKYVAADFRDALLTSEAHWMTSEMIENGIA